MKERKHIHTIIDLKNILKTALHLIKEAGANTLQYFDLYKGCSSHTQVCYKGDNSPVTEADRSTETFLRKKLMHHFPDFGIIGEEYDSYNIEARYKWIIDPIDGTQSFIKGVALYTVLLGLYDSVRNIPILGCIYCPPSGECVYATINEGAFFTNLLNNTTSLTSLHCNTTINKLTDALVLSYDFVAAMKVTPSMHTIMLEARLTRTWADGYAYLLLACSRAHAIIDAKMHIWDIVPIYPIMKECGAFVHTFKGNQVEWEPLLSAKNHSIKNASINVICTSSKELTSEILEIIHK